eukprot:5591732-Amphidinium_carterae.1
MEEHWADLHVSPQKSCSSPQYYRACLVFHCGWSKDGGPPGLAQRTISVLRIGLGDLQVVSRSRLDALGRVYMYSSGFTSTDQPPLASLDLRAFTR